MPDVTVKRNGELVRGVFSILLGHADGLPAKEVLVTLEKKVPPTEFERASYPSNPSVRRFEKMVRFATIAAVKAGWLAKDKGVWSVTDEGRGGYEKFRDPEAFRREMWRLYRRWAQDQPRPEEVAEAEAPDAEATLEEAEEGAWEEIQEHLQKMNPYEFQNLVAGLLKAMDYHVTYVAPPGPDGGTDIIANTDPLGMKGPRIRVQVKRRADRIPVDGVRAFMAVLASGDVGLFVSTGGFTKDAAEEARSQEIRRITLIDLKRLFDLWVEHYDKIEETARWLLPLKPIYYLLPEE
jgi:restriction system protein